MKTVSIIRTLFLSAASVAALVLAFSFTASAQPKGKPKAPPPASVPKSCSCAECGMLVKADSPFVSQIIFADGKDVFFCDLGDLFLYYEVLKDRQDVAALYVKDYEGGGWADGFKAYYLTGAKVRTPMRYGILSFSGKAAAEKFKASQGGDTVMGFDEVMSSRVYRR